MRKRNHIIKKKKKPTHVQLLTTRRQLRLQLRRANDKLEFLQWVNTPEPILWHNETNRALPGVA
jgi:hypothetical protein